MNDDMKERLRMDRRKLVTNREHMALERYEAQVHRYQLNGVLRPRGRWKSAQGR